jgi:hypothetical protein
MSKDDPFKWQRRDTMVVTAAVVILIVAWAVVTYLKW